MTTEVTAHKPTAHISISCTTGFQGKKIHGDYGQNKPQVPHRVKRNSTVLSQLETNQLSLKKRMCNIPEDGILHSHRHENLKSYKVPNI
jgi:hypothetical protein